MDEKLKKSGSWPFTGYDLNNLTTRKSQNNLLNEHKSHKGSLPDCKCKTVILIELNREYWEFEPSAVKVRDVVFSVILSK